MTNSHLILWNPSLFASDWVYQGYKGRPLWGAKGPLCLAIWAEEFYYRPCWKFLHYILRFSFPSLLSFSSPQGSDLHCGLAAHPGSSSPYPIFPQRHFSQYKSCVSNISLAAQRTQTYSVPGKGHTSAKALRRLAFSRDIKEVTMAFLSEDGEKW